MFGKKNPSTPSTGSTPKDGQAGQAGSGEEKKGENYNEIIKENVSIHKMPKDIKRGIPKKDPKPSKELEKTIKKESKKENAGFLKGEDKTSASSSDSSWDKTKIIGAVIIFSGVIILFGGIYLGYVYFIKPAEGEPVTLVSDNKNSEESENKESAQGASDAVDESLAGDSEEVVEEEEEIIEEEEEVVEEGEASTTPEEEEETGSTTVEIEEGVQYQDSDEDGLSDLEETILGLSSDKKDSDSDGYDDKQELLNLYNPGGDGVLSENSQISEYVSERFAYSLLYPSKWADQKVDSNNAVMFRAQDGSFVQVIVRSNDEGMSIKDWYEQQFSDTSAEIEVEEGDGWQGIRKDGSYIYLTDLDRKNIYIISLTSLTSEEDEYKNIFSMMVNSFEIK